MCICYTLHTLATKKDVVFSVPYCWATSFLIIMYLLLLICKMLYSNASQTVVCGPGVVGYQPLSSSCVATSCSITLSCGIFWGLPWDLDAFQALWEAIELKWELVLFILPVPDTLDKKVPVHHRYTVYLIIVTTQISSTSILQVAIPRAIFHVAFDRDWHSYFPAHFMIMFRMQS